MDGGWARRNPHPHFEHRALVGLQHFKRQAVTLHFLPGGGHVSKLVHHQPGHGRVIAGLEGDLYLTRHLRQLRVPGEQVT